MSFHDKPRVVKKCSTSVTNFVGVFGLQACRQGLLSLNHGDFRCDFCDSAVLQPLAAAAGQQTVQLSAIAGPGLSTLRTSKCLQQCVLDLLVVLFILLVHDLDNLCCQRSWGIPTDRSLFSKLLIYNSISSSSVILGSWANSLSFLSFSLSRFLYDAPRASSAAPIC